MRTFSAKKNDTPKKWYVIDAKDKVLGRLSTRVADILRGKNKVVYTPHVDTGDYVIIINADKIKLTGNKWKDKVYHTHSGYLGGLKSITAQDLIRKDPQKLLVHSVKGMLPKNKLNRQIISKLKVCAGSDHKYEAQKPEVLEI